MRAAWVEKRKIEI